MVVTDLSCLGVKFKLNDVMSFDIGEIVLLEFNLDDNSRSFISKKVRIMSVNGREIGAEFCDMDPAESAYKAIKFYVY